MTDEGERTRRFSLSSRAGFETALAGALLALSLAFTLLFLLRLSFDLDEVEFVRATRFVLDGSVPFRDFFEHHPPLQWVVMAPFMGLFAKGADLGTFLAMRALQIPIWLGTALLAYRWAKERGATRSWALLTLALLFADAFFAVYVVEYRVDALMNLCFLLGLFCAERALAGGGKEWLFALGGAFWALACLSSQRIAPAVAAATLLYLFARGEKRWGWNPRALAIAAGGGALALSVTSVLWATGALSPFWQQVVKLNFAYEGLHEGQGTASFAHQFIVSPLGRPYLLPLFCMWVLGAIALVRSLARLVRPGASVRVALLFVAQSVTLVAIHPVLPYHFLALWWLLALLVPAEVSPLLERRPRLNAVAVGIIAAALLGGMAWTYKRIDWARLNAAQEVQAGLIRGVQGVTSPDETVWEGGGYALDRAPAGRYWFTPSLVVDMTKAGILPPFTVADLLAQRPAAVLMGARFASYIDVLPSDLKAEVLRDYLPKTAVLWVPAPNARLSPEAPVHQWTVLKSGRYRLGVSAVLERSEWFQGTPTFLDLYFDLMDKGADVAWPRAATITEGTIALEANGRPLAPFPDGSFALKAGQRVQARWKGEGAVAVALLPRGMDSCRLPPPSGRLGTAAP